MEATESVAFLDMLLPMVLILFVIAIGVILLNQHFQRNLHRQQLKQEILKQDYQQQLLRSSIEVQERERKRIAQDLHDELGATLSIAKMQLMQLERFPEQQGMLTNIRQSVEAAITSTRRISHELLPPQLERFGLYAALDKVAVQVNTGNEVQVKVHHPLEDKRLPWMLEVALYRICLELINNTLKHARATEIFIDLITEDVSKCVFLYTDNGIGLRQNTSNDGLGLKSMEARVKAVGGELSLTGANGFQVRIVLPV